MSLIDEESFEDPILNLSRDPDLNRTPHKKALLKTTIESFSPAERRVSNLCKTSVAILRVLEEIELNLKNWAFLSLDINSNNHFDTSNDEKIKSFNAGVAIKVLKDCEGFNRKLHRLSMDIDRISKEVQLLSYKEYILDSGTLLLSLILRVVRLKDKITEKVKVAYLKAKLIKIGTDLESLVTSDEEEFTVKMYKNFVVSLLSQLNDAVNSEDVSSTYECFAVILDLEKMFEAFRLDRLQQMAAQAKSMEQAKSSKQNYRKLQHTSESEYDSDDYEAYDDDFPDFGDSVHSSRTSQNFPTIHSITKESRDSRGLGRELTNKSDSFLLKGSSSLLQKTSISDEVPYLMSAFNLAKVFEEDVKHYKGSQEKDLSRNARDSSLSTKKVTQSNIETSKGRKQHERLGGLNNSMDAFNFLQTNYSTLSMLGIRPQVIEASFDKENDEENVE